VKAHPIAGIICVMAGVFGGIFLFAFAMAFDPTVVVARDADAAAPKEKGRKMLDLVFTVTNGLGGRASLSEYRRVWVETKGTRFLVPLGLALCGLSFILYREFLA
jgi:hypothetical protein